MSSEDGDIVMGGTYNIKDEAPPDAPFYNEKFQKAIIKGRNIAKSIFEALSEVTAINQLKEIQEIRTEAERLSRFTLDKTRIIGLLGSSGEGKSSLINSLLGLPEISPTNAGGAACTSIVTEFRNRKMDQTSPILIEIERFTDEEMKGMIEQAVADYRKFVYMGGSDDSDSETQYTNGEEYAIIKKDHDLGWATLDSAFGDHDEFSEEFLKGESLFQGKEIAEQCIEWAQESVWPEAEGVTKVEYAENAEGCSDLTSSYMEGNIWPFIKIIRVHLESPLLQAGIVLVDLPGLQDTNAARVKATESYLFRCEHFFIISNLSRIMTDKSTKDSLLHVLSKHISLKSTTSESLKKGSSKMAKKTSLKFSIVCTKSDSMSVKGLKREIKRHGTIEVKKLLEQLEESCPSEDVTGQVDPKMSDFINIYRSEKVRQGINTTYSSQVEGETIEVFPVSNTSYESGVVKGDHEAVDSSGIPKLRRYCYSLAAAEQYTQYSHFLKTLIAGVLNAIQVWVDCTDDKLREMSKRKIKDVDERMLDLEKDISTLHRDIQNMVIKDFGEVKKYESRASYWTAAALERAKKFASEWHNSSYAAWCRRFGVHKTKLRPYTNWNHEFLWMERMELISPLEQFKDNILFTFDTKMRPSIERLFDKLGDWAIKEGFPLSIKDSIRLEKEKVVNDICEGRIEFIEKELLVAEIKAIEGNTSSFIRARMEPAYQLAREEKGKGRTKRQIQAIEECLSEDLFEGILEDFGAEVRNITGQALNTMLYKTTMKTGRIKRNFHYALDPPDRSKTEDMSRKGLIYMARDVLHEKLKILQAEHDLELKPVLA
jgi:energy-coupling factor transporter ATP-binding protein EcfA2